LLGSQVGSVTMEYVIISTFALVISVAAVTMVAGLFKEKINSVNEKLGLKDEDKINFDFMNNE
jgi:hypothetical protein